MMTRCHTRYCAFLVSLFISLPSYSGTVEAAQWIPWKVLVDEFRGQIYTVDEVRDEYQLQIGELTAKLSDVSVRASGSNLEVRFNDQGLETSLSLEGSLSLSGIIVDQIITREFNGNIIQVHVKAQCSGLGINIKKMFAEGNFLYKQNSTKWVPEIDLLSLELSPNDWSVTTLTCSGIGGIGEEISKEIQKALKDPNLFSPLLVSLIKQESSKLINKLWEDVITSAGEDLVIKKMHRPDLNGLTIIGDLVIASARVEKAPRLENEKFSDNHPQLILSKKGFEALMEDQYLKISSSRWNLQDIKGFKDLMASRVVQYFVWPDLRRFSSQTPFYLSMIPNESRLILSSSGLNSWQAQVNSNGRIITSIGGSEIEYIYLGISYSTNLSVEIDNGEIILKNSNAEINMAWSYGLLYQILYKPNQKISTKILKSAVKDALSNRTITSKLPSLTIAEKEWVLQNWQQEENLITMDWL